MDKWFAIQSTSKHEDTIRNVNSLLKHPQFDDTNPNKINNGDKGFNVSGKLGR